MFLLIGFPDQRNLKSDFLEFWNSSFGAEKVFNFRLDFFLYKYLDVNLLIWLSLNSAIFHTNEKVCFPISRQDNSHNLNPTAPT